MNIESKQTPGTEPLTTDALAGELFERHNRALVAELVNAKSKLLNFSHGETWVQFKAKHGNRFQVAAWMALATSLQA